MAEFIIATSNIDKLQEELAINVLAEKALADKVMKLTVSNSESTRTVWFLPQETSSESMGKGAVILGLASAQSADMLDPSPALIENEGSSLILGVDF
jgi:hypothetical protein